MIRLGLFFSALSVPVAWIWGERSWPDYLFSAAGIACLVVGLFKYWREHSSP